MMRAVFLTYSKMPSFCVFTWQRGQANKLSIVSYKGTSSILRAPPLWSCLNLISSLSQLRVSTDKLEERGTQFHPSEKEGGQIPKITKGIPKGFPCKIKNSIWHISVVQ